MPSVCTLPGVEGSVSLFDIVFSADILLAEDSGISLALCAQVPVSELAGPEVSMKWVSEHGGGFFRSGTKNPHGYTVLFDLKRCVNMDKGFLQRLFGRGEGSLPASEDADM